jgi:hypothetical protein
VEEIYKVYKAKADDMLGAKPGRLLARHLLQTRHQVALQQAFTMLGHEQHVSPPEKPPLSSLEEVFHWLDTMAATLRRISGV